mmetsp:Transcript_24288/g.48317  ORF Transcript_24288/g.48317 Transcript_24288/m.48317 type:complete len:581 (+) Transcript_24288:325-2067(+)
MNHSTMKLSRTKSLLFLLITFTIVTCYGEEGLVVRVLKGGGKEISLKDGDKEKSLKGGGQGKSNNGEAKSKKTGHQKAKSSKRTYVPTTSITPTMLPKCKSSKGKRSKGHESKSKAFGAESSFGPFPGWCPFGPDQKNASKSKTGNNHYEHYYNSKNSKKKSKAHEDDAGKPFSFLNGILGHEPKTKVIVLTLTDMTSCLQTSVDDGDFVLIIDTCRFDDNSMFTIDRYGRFHTTQGWGQCVVADATGTDITPGPCYDCGAIFSYDADLSLIRLYEDPTTVISFRGTDVFLAEEIIEPTCTSSEPILSRLDDELIEQNMVIIAIDNLELPTDSPAPSSSMPPTRTTMPTTPFPTIPPTPLPTSLPPTLSPTSLPTTSTPTLSPSFPPTSSLEELNDANIGAAVTVYMIDPVKGSAHFGDITKWDTSRLTSAYGLFDKTLYIDSKNFNMDIGSWDISGVYFASYLFNGAGAFDQYIGDWDISSLMYMQSMFQNAVSFNQNIRSWDMSKAVNLYAMFKGASIFNQDLTMWSFNSAMYVEKMFWDSGMNIQSCFDLSGDLYGACDIFKGSAGGDFLFCSIDLC